MEGGNIAYNKMQGCVCGDPEKIFLFGHTIIILDFRNYGLFKSIKFFIAVNANYYTTAFI